MVAEDVRRMSTDQLILWVTVATLFVAFIAVIVTVFYGEIERRLGRRQLVLAQEQAELQPKLSLSIAYSSESSGGYEAMLDCAINNAGHTTAHNVTCKLELDSRRMIEIVGHGDEPYVYLFAPGDLSPAAPYRDRLMVDVYQLGLVRGHYRCWCDEARMTEGTFEVEVTEPVARRPEKLSGRRVKIKPHSWDPATYTNANTTNAQHYVGRIGRVTDVRVKPSQVMVVNPHEYDSILVRVRLEDGGESTFEIRDIKIIE